MGWLKNPNLPYNRVICAITGAKYSYLDEYFLKLGTAIIHVPDNVDVNPDLSGHADLSVFHTGGNSIFISQSIKAFKPVLEYYGFDVLLSAKPCSDIYPNDAGLNACLLDNRLFHNKKCSDKTLTDFAAKNKLKYINVSQGYTKCSVCVVDAEHIITEDKSIHKAAESCGIESLLISSGYIKLDGFAYGFVGGASGKLSKNILAFTGTLKHHPDENKILDYLKLCGVEPFYLTDMPCFDIGSIIPVKEAEP
jgi:hypothetical protein